MRALAIVTVALTSWTDAQHRQGPRQHDLHRQPPERHQGSQSALPPRTKRKLRHDRSGLIEDDHERSAHRPPVGHRPRTFGEILDEAWDAGTSHKVREGSNTGGDHSGNSGGVCKSIVAIEKLRIPTPEELAIGRFDVPIGQIGSDSDAGGATSSDADDADGEFLCELQSGRTVPLHSTAEQKQELRRAMEEGRFVSAVSTIDVQEAETAELPRAPAVEMTPALDETAAIDLAIADGVNDSRPASGPSVDPLSDPLDRFESVTLPSGSVQLSTDPHRRLQHHQRSLANYSGTKPTLVIRVTDSLGRSVPDNAQVVSDKIFGTHGDSENMKSQFASCSMGNFNVVSNQYGTRTRWIVDKLSADGVLEVNIPISLDNPQQLIRNHVVRAAEAKLGTAGLGPAGRLPGPFSHVLVVTEKCYQGCGWAAYAYVNSWMSVYQGVYYKHPAVQMHEVGHNLNLAHSGGMDGKTYTDHSCLMGNPLFHDDHGDMCFNPAKNYQIVTGNGNAGGNWYGRERVEVWNPNVQGNVWRGTLVGVAEYSKLSSSWKHAHSRVVLKVESGTANDLYLGFNRKIGINSDNKEASDLVTVVQTGGNGVNYSTSHLKAKLGRSGVYTHPKFRQGEDLVVTVEEVDTGESPGYATVRVQLGETPAPTRGPTNPPTNRPSEKPTPRPTSEPTDFPTSKPTKRPTRWPTASPTPQPSDAPTTNSTIEGGSTAGGRAGGSAAEIIEFLTTVPDAQARMANGTMFTIEAPTEDVTITSLSTYTQINAVAPIQLYYRDGAYQGHTSNEEGWTLLYDSAVHQKGQSELTRLGPFLDDQSVLIPAGQSVSFYVYTPLKLRYQYRSEWSEGQQIIDDGNVRLLAGIALAYGKWEEGCDVSPQADGQCVFSPRVFSGSLEYTLGDSSAPGGVATTTATTPSTSTGVTTTSTEVATTTSTVNPAPPSSSVEFITPNWNGARSTAKGLVISIEATQDIAIRGLQYIAKRAALGGVNIYYRPGKYEGLEISSDGWTRIYSGNVAGQAGEVVDLGDFAEEVQVAAGDTVSFYAFTRKGQMFVPGSAEGEAYGSDNSIVVHEGLVTKGLFRRQVGTGRWAGIVRYSTD